MADDSIPSGSSDTPPQQDQRASGPAANLNGASPAPPGLPPKPRRPVYEPTLFPVRKRRRISRWIVIPALLVLCLGLYYFLLVAPHRHPYINTVGKIAYASDQGSPGTFHLWIADAAGGGTRPLTSGAASDTHPAFSPDGSQIAFVSNRVGGRDQIYLMGADGKNVTQMTRNTGAKALPVFAPHDSSLLAFTAGGILNVGNPLSGESSRALPPAVNTHAQNTDVTATATSPTIIPAFAWSPDEAARKPGLAAVEETEGLDTLALIPNWDAKPRENLMAADTMSLGWSPDGGLLAVAMLGVKGMPGGQTGSAIMLFDSQGNPITHPPLALTQDTAVGPQNPVFSPDGAQILFELWRQPNLADRTRHGLFLVPVDGSAAPRQIYKGDAEMARYTTDGSAILFLSQRKDGGHDLYRIAPDGTGLQRLSDGHVDVRDFAVSPQTAPK